MASRIFALLLLVAPGLGAQERLAVRSEPGSPVVAVEVLIAGGSGREPEDQAGVAFLASRVAIAPIRPILDSLGARLQVEAHKDALGFTLTVAPEVWMEASRLLLVALFRDPADPGAVERERRAARAELIGRETNPADVAAREADAVVFGRGHPWARPAVGTSESVQRLGMEEVDGFIRANFVPRRTAVAVVGPVATEEVRQHLAPFFQGAAWEPVEPRPPRPTEAEIPRAYSSITTWVVASYLFPPEVDAESLRLLADIIRESLATGTHRHLVYNAAAEIIRRPGAGELRVQIVVAPTEVERWAGRIREIVDRHAEEEMTEGVFRERVRRFRGERLRGMSAPEARAAAAARDLLMGGAGAGPLVDVDRLTPERLRDAARELEGPTIVFLGPSSEPGI